MEWENDNPQSDENEAEESNRRSKDALRMKKHKKHKKDKKHKKHNKYKRYNRDISDEIERTDRGADGSLPSYSKKEVKGNIEDLSPKSNAYCSCLCHKNGKNMYVRRLRKSQTDKSSIDDDDNQKAEFFQRMQCFTNNDNNCDENNPPPASKSDMELVLNKLRPYLSLPAEDEPKLMKRLSDLGVGNVEDLHFLNFETDLQGIMKVVQCRKLKLELSKDITIHENINTQSEIHNASPSIVKHKRPDLTQPTAEFNFTMPQFNESVRKSLETRIVPNVNGLYTNMTMSVPMLDVKSNLRTQEYRQFVRMLEKKFLSAIKYGTIPGRYSPPIDGENLIEQDQKKTILKCLHSLSRKEKNIQDWDLITRFMDTTYAYQRYMITHPQMTRKVLLEWPYLGKGQYLKKHFYFLTNTEETALNNFRKTIPTMFKFVQAIAEKKQKNNDLQKKLMAIIKNNSNKNAHDEFLTVLLCYMAIMEENAEHIFIRITDVKLYCDESFKNVPSSVPLVLFIGDLWSNPICYVFVNKQCLWSDPLEILEAIQIMFMTYYVFNLNYPTELAGILQFLQSYMFNIKDESNKIEKCIPKLLRLMNDYDNYVKKLGDRGLNGL